VDRGKAIVEVLDKRRMAQETDVDVAWSGFVDDHLPVPPLFDSSKQNLSFLSVINKKQTHSRRRFTRVAIAAALVATFLLGATLSAVAAGNRLKHTTVLWSKDTFPFAYGHPEKEQMDENEVLYPLRDMMDGSGLRENVVPNYLPTASYRQSWSRRTADTRPSIPTGRRSSPSCTKRSQRTAIPSSGGTRSCRRFTA
jgi:hypothetical protein